MGTDAETMLDPAAKVAYRARIEELRRDLEEAEDYNDLERASQARTELDFIVEELTRAVGLGGRDRGSPRRESGRAPASASHFGLA